MIPSTHSPSYSTRDNLLKPRQLLPLLFPRRPPYPRLRQPTRPEPASPICRLPYRHRIHPPIDPAYPLFPPNIHKRLPRTWRLDPLGCDLVFCDFDGLHAGAEAHCGVGLGNAAGHAAGDAADEIGGPEGFGVEFGFGGDEEEDGAFG